VVHTSKAAPDFSLCINWQQEVMTPRRAVIGKCPDACLRAHKGVMPCSLSAHTWCHDVAVDWIDAPLRAPHVWRSHEHPKVMVEP